MLTGCLAAAAAAAAAFIAAGYILCYTRISQKNLLSTPIIEAHSWELPLESNFTFLFSFYQYYFSIYYSMNLSPFPSLCYCTKLLYLSNSHFFHFHTTYTFLVAKVYFNKNKKKCTNNNTTTLKTHYFFSFLQTMKLFFPGGFTSL